MPQTDIFFDDEDKRRLLQYLLNERFSFVPDILYSEPKYRSIADLESYLELGKLKPTIFLTHPSYSTSPLEMKQLNKGEAAGKFYIVQRSGGPVIEVICPGNYTRNQVSRVAPGMITYHKTYWNTSTRQTEEAPACLKEAYKKIVRFVQENSVPSDPRGFHVGSHAASEFLEGKVKLINALRYPYSVDPQRLKSKMR